MSGVFGVVDPSRSVDVTSVVEQMAQVMSYADWFVADRYVDDVQPVALGRMGIGIFNQGAQPVWNADRSVALLMAGELYNKDMLAGKYSLTSSGDEALALALYEKQGERFVSELDGAFVIAIWDRAQRCLLLANDRFALYPTFIAQVGQRFLFAPEVKAILVDRNVDRSLRADAIAEYVRFQHLLGYKTFFDGVELLPAASVLIYSLDDATTKVQRYWDIGQTSALRASISFDEAVEEGSRLFRRAVEKRVRATERVGVFLSGGLDGRAILGMMPSNGKTVHTFTFGQAGCRDEYYARQIARVAGAQHHYTPFENGKWIPEFIDLHLQTTEGFHPWIHMHGVSMLSDARQHTDVNLSGLGDLLWTQPNFIPRHLVNAPDDIAFNAIFFDLYNQKYTWPGLTDAEETSLYHPSFAPRVRGLALESFVKEQQPYAHLAYAQRASAFNLVNHFLRYIFYSGVLGRSHIEFRFPYFDIDLLSFCYALPYELGYDRRLQKAILIKETPALSRVPTADDELPVTLNQGRHRVAHLTQKLKSGFHQYVAPIFPPRATLYADYEEWLRTDLRSWAQDILLDDRTLGRGIFRPEALRSLLNRHLAGQQLWTIGKLAHLITFELMLRRWGD